MNYLEWKRLNQKIWPIKHKCFVHWQKSVFNIILETAVKPEKMVHFSWLLILLITVTDLMIILFTHTTVVFNSCFFFFFFLIWKNILSPGMDHPITTSWWFTISLSMCSNRMNGICHQELDANDVYRHISYKKIILRIFQDASQSTCGPLTTGWRTFCLPSLLVILLNFQIYFIHNNLIRGPWLINYWLRVVSDRWQENITGSTVLVFQIPNKSLLECRNL